ncbi:hypothetical protein [Maridesulfovibrio sp. FT414]|uniref:hypothetical protein n=1 Tax=Maridesulfovibrio sp. FT414 TaxID=2979469 RepID=UPI003D8052E6
MKKLILIAAALTVLGGCSSWHNPNIADPSEAAEILARDKAFCNQQTQEEVPIASETDGAPPEPTTYEAKFSEDYTSASTFDECMKQRGWIKK